MKLIAPIEKDEDIVNKQYVDNKVSTKVENTETGISAALDKINTNTTNAADTDVYITKVNNKYYKRPLSYLWNWIKTKVEALGYTKNTGTLTGIKMNGVSKGTSGVVDLGKVLTGGSQTTTSTQDGGNNVYTFSDNSTITIRNGTKGSKGDIGPQGPQGEKGDTGTAATISVGTVTTGAAGTNAVVTNAGTSSAAKFNFTIPRGANGTSATWFTGTAVTGTSTTAVTVSVTGSKAGDMYLNTSTYNVYSATAANSWVYKCNIKGATGSTGSSGAAAGFGTPTATVDANTGTPSVTVTATGTNTAKVFNFAFKNLKGEKGSDANITWGNTYVTNADEAPLGFSRISNQGINNPFTFWVTLLTMGESETSGYKQQWAFPWGDAEATMQAPKYRVKDNGNWGNWTSLKNGGNADAVGGIAVTKLKGNDTKFIYTSQNGLGEHNLTEFKEEGHYFVFNYNDSPTNYGFLDISVFDGSGFTPMPNGIIRQSWTDFIDPSKNYMRIYNSTSATEGSWTDWKRISDSGNGYLPLTGGNMTGNINIKSNTTNCVTLGRHTASGSGDVSYGYIHLYNSGSIAGDIFGKLNTSKGKRGIVIRPQDSGEGGIGDSSHYFDSAYINTVNAKTIRGRAIMRIAGTANTNIDISKRNHALIIATRWITLNSSSFYTTGYYYIDNTTPTSSIVPSGQISSSELTLAFSLTQKGIFKANGTFDKFDIILFD